MFLSIVLLEMLEKGGRCVLLWNLQTEQPEDYFIVRC